MLHSHYFIGTCVFLGGCLLLFCSMLVYEQINLAVADNILAESILSSNYNSDYSQALSDNKDGDRHYAVIVDAGSSGSRVFVYYWPTHSGHLNELLNITQLTDSLTGKPVAKKVTPGLSTFSSNPLDVPAYIKQLLDYAASYIPQVKHKETPIYVLATAGMRLLPEESQNAILEEVRITIKMHYHFLFSNPDQAMVITGKDEGMYGWIATNYLLGRFFHDHNDRVPVVAVPVESDSSFRQPHQHMHYRKRTVGVLDMGGASMQIAFEVEPDKLDSLKYVDKEQVTEFNLGCRQDDAEHTYRLYVTTFLGYGANAARSRYEDLLAKNPQLFGLTYLGNDSFSSLAPSIQSSAPFFEVQDACAPVGAVVDKTSIVVSNSTAESLSSAVTVRLVGTGLLSACLNNLQHALNLTNNEALCGSTAVSKAVCTMQGAAQPKLDLSSAHFYGFSEFWYSMNDILKLGGSYDYSKFSNAVRRFCGGNWKKMELDLHTGQYPKGVDTDRLRHQCFKASWILAVLHNGFKFPRNFRQFTSVNEIADTEVQWTLGALLYRTRYYPLREVQRKELERIKLMRVSTSISTRYHYLLLIILVGLLLSCMVYINFPFCKISMSFHRFLRRVSSLNNISSNSNFYRTSKQDTLLYSSDTSSNNKDFFIADINLGNNNCHSSNSAMMYTYNAYNMNCVKQTVSNRDFERGAMQLSFAT